MALIEVQATAQLGDFSINERRMVDTEDEEMAALIEHGLLIEVNEHTARSLAPPAGAKVGGCNCRGNS